MQCPTEEKVYKRLGLDYIEPELREGRGEIAAAAAHDAARARGRRRHPRRPALPHDSLRRAQLARGDGRSGPERGYAYLAITEHSASHGFGNHVTPKQLEARIEEVREWNSSAPRGFRLLAGSEVNIGTDGGLDYEDELLAELDWVIASVHTSFRISGKRMTDRVIAAVENPLVDCIGHLTGRLIGRREPYDIDVERVAAAAAAAGTMLEINGNPNRRDLSEHHARLAADAGVAIAVNTDAHGIDTLGNILYGVATARRAWLTKAEVANTRTWAQFRSCASLDAGEDDRSFENQRRRGRCRSGRFRAPS